MAVLVSALMAVTITLQMLTIMMECSGGHLSIDLFVDRSSLGQLVGKSLGKPFLFEI